MGVEDHVSSAPWEENKRHKAPGCGRGRVHGPRAGPLLCAVSVASGRQDGTKKVLIWSPGSCANLSSDWFTPAVWFQVLKRGWGLLNSNTKALPFLFLEERGALPSSMSAVASEGF